MVRLRGGEWVREGRSEKKDAYHQYVSHLQRMLTLDNQYERQSRAGISRNLKDLQKS
jgi:hypothetical protein